MQASAYNTLRTQLDFRKNPSMFLRQLIVDGLLIAGAVTLLTKGPWGFVASQVILAVVFFRGFSLMHDAVHHCVATNRHVNALAGHIGGILCFMPFESWKRLHLEHHIWAGNIDQDPSSKLRKDYDPRRKFKYAVLTLFWRSWVPLLGLLQEVVFWTYPLQQFKRTDYSRAAKLKIALSMALPFATYTALYFLFPATFRLATIGPGFGLYLMMVELINFPHHMDVYAFRGTGKLPFNEQHRVTRSSYYPTWFSRGFLLNFNLHVEHHLYPTLPWYQLDKARPLVKAALGADYNESIGNAWVLKNRRKPMERFLPLPEEQIPEKLNRVG